MTDSTPATIEGRLIVKWRPPYWTGTDDERPGWRVICSEHGELEDGWAYMREQDAKAVATRHERKYHRGVQVNPSAQPNALTTTSARLPRSTCRYRSVTTTEECPR